MYWTSERIDTQLCIDRLYSFFEETYSKDYIFEGEMHNFWECVYIADGEVCASADGRVYNLSKGELIIHKPLEFHKFHILSEKGATIVVFSFSLDGPLADSLRNKIITLSAEEEHIMSLLLNYTKMFSRDSKNFLDTFDAPPHYLQTIASYMTILLLGFTTGSSAAKTVDSFDSLVYEKAVRYMNENIKSNIKVPDIAAHCNVGATFLKLTFKKYSGLSVHKFFISLKMRYALELLKNGHSVTEVSLELGFCSQPYFSQAFRREFGFPPSEV